MLKTVAVIVLLVPVRRSMSAGLAESWMSVPVPATGSLLVQFTTASATRASSAMAARAAAVFLMRVLLRNYHSE